MSRAKRGIRGDRGVYRAAALLHHVECDLRGQWMRGSRHRMRRDDFRTRGEITTGDAVGGVRRQAGREQEDQEWITALHCCLRDGLVNYLWCSLALE